MVRPHVCGSGTGRAGGAGWQPLTRCIAETVYYEPGRFRLCVGKRIPETFLYRRNGLSGGHPEALWKLDGTFFPDRGNGLSMWKAVIRIFMDRRTEDDTMQQYAFKVLPGTEQTVLTEEDLPYLTEPGHLEIPWERPPIIRGKGPEVRAYLNQEAGGGENSFVKRISLVYHGQNAVTAGWRGASGQRYFDRTSGVGKSAASAGQVQVQQNDRKSSYRNTPKALTRIMHKDWWTDRYDEQASGGQFPL